MKALSINRRWWVMGVILLALLAGISVFTAQQRTAQATFGCGSVLNGGSHTLTHDIGPCAGAFGV